MHTPSLVFSKALVTEILGYAQSRDIHFHMMFGRNLVSFLLTGKPYSQMMAPRNGREPAIVRYDDTYRAQLVAEYPDEAGRINELAAIVEHFLFWSPDRLSLLTTITKAVRQGILAPPPVFTAEALDTYLRSRAIPQADIELVRADDASIHRGRHLTFVHRGASSYVVEDFLVEDALGQQYGHVSIVVDGFMVFGRQRLGDHAALAWAYDAGAWQIQWLEHRLASPNDFNLTFNQLVNGG